MRHFEAGVLADFARGLLPEDDDRAVRSHLSIGCAQCAPAAQFFGRFARVSTRMKSEAVPENVLRIAKAIIPPRWSAPRRVNRTKATLVFDSLVAPAPVGFRSEWNVGWQGLYRAGECSLDLRIEPELDSSRAAVIGQIFNQAAPEREISDLPVQLRYGRSVIAETRSNNFGEFQLEYQQQSRLQLHIYFKDGSQCIHLPLKRLAGQNRGTGDRLGSHSLTAHKGDGKLPGTKGQSNTKGEHE